MKKIMIIFIILIIILLFLTYFQKSRRSPEEGIELVYGDQHRFLPYSKILSMEKTNFSTRTKRSMSGIDLLKILDTLNIPLTAQSEYIFKSNDGGTLKLIKKQDETFYLVFQESGDDQYMRLVIPSDEFSQRWMKYITSIEIK